ncbi:CxxxxCH/CxxCH domain-containing protein [Geothrix sp. PMB-07]|uniref:CxxxxCH/CxxCH domain c-type cytochrome n=1 Tax=Geothrix sp. PMB-07 TaxID=3068640 RepID=UPI00274079F6|nr:CxxxxCH/CxxCH domain-containing protein [Geothrix sp. PMB-07]WLT31527.1 CxxxxCH/CxxCH domain-containing protein [Geothrix sp. PMB-07]
MRRGSFLGRGGLILLGLLVLVACGGGKGAGSTAQYYGNYHPLGWIDGTHGQKAHGAEAVASISTCTRCHEISILKVGSGVPTCMTSGCHHQSTPNFADPAVHGLRARLAISDASGGSLVSCQICHGRDFAGGASAQTCASCHGVPAPHPVRPWRAVGGSTLTHAGMDPSNAVVCAQCHLAGSSLNPVGHPTTPAPAATQPGCFNATLCHGDKLAPHPVPFLTGLADAAGNGHMTVTAGTFAADCSTCHAYSGTSPSANAPLCNVCHQLADPVAAGTQAGTCLSCHAGAPGLPHGPGGSAFPSTAGAHAKHMALPTALTCDTCHAGSGTGTNTHYTNANARNGAPAGPAPVAMDAVFQAQTGGALAFTAASLTCSNVSCHGGQATPGWQTGTLNSATQCTACHKVAASAGATIQFNDAFGRHSLNTHDATNPANAIACTTCHNMGNGSPGALAHFKYLDTQAVDGVSTGSPADQLPSGTIVFDTAVVAGPGTYSVTSATQGNGGCALTCHTHLHTASFDTWTSSGAPHPIPFLKGQVDLQGNGHLELTAAAFTADCAACHAYAAPTPLAGVPLCSVCHKLADPVQVATGKGTCLSCHVGPSGLPAGPTGVTFPSIAGSHPKHMALPTTLTCDTCHANAGTGTATHYTNANARVATPVAPSTVNIDAAFHSQSGGAAGFTPAALTCSNVSCHGGKATPNWQTGTIASSSQCLSCHAINGGTSTSQFNDAVGRHAWGTHSTAGTLDCTLCHDMTLATPGAQNHFAELNTTAVSSTNKLPSTTIKFKLSNTTYPITGAATYTINATTPEGDGGCALTCHSQIHNPTDNHWNAPKGSGVAHPVPFYSTDVSTGGNHHQTLTLAQFNNECATCHDLSGASSKAGPACSVCHTLGDPTAVATGAGTCLSCHVGAAFKTQGPTGSAWPNIQGSHPKHLSLLTFTRGTPTLPASLTASVCEACHVGSVPGDATNTHYSNANKRAASPILTPPASVAIDPAFNAKSGTANIAPSASAFTCSNVSCHGGQTTPGWQSGTLTKNATTYCIACHKVTSAGTQYNDASGRHTNPGEHNTTCDYCHDMTQAKPGAQNHFKYLDTSDVRVSPDQLSSDTILFGPNVTGARTYTTTATLGRGNCTLSCHGESHSPKQWQ